MGDTVATSMVLSKPRRYRSIEERRSIVEKALVPGASVAEIARAHGVNANLVFHWRKLYRAGLLAETDAVRLLPVRVEAKGKNKKRRAANTAAEENGTVEVSLANSQVRIAGRVNEEVVRAVLECLLA